MRQTRKEREEDMETGRERIKDRDRETQGGKDRAGMVSWIKDSLAHTEVRELWAHSSLGWMHTHTLTPDVHPGEAHHSSCSLLGHGHWFWSRN